MQSHRAFLLCLLALPACLCAEDSPQFRGPDRDGRFSASGLLRSWPEAGPTKLWSQQGLGEGYASVSVVGGGIYTTGSSGGMEFLLAFDTEGRPLWKTAYGEVHSGGGYPGTRTTPTFDQGLLFVFSSRGVAVALDAESGEIRWKSDLGSDFKAEDITWGLAESPLAFDGKVVFTPGGPEATMVALDQKSGERVWVTSGLGEASGYCSPRLFDNGRIRQIITLTKGHLIGVDPANGNLVWKQPYPASYGIHAVSPLFHGNLIYVSDGYKQGGKAFDLAADGKGVALEWKDEDLDVHHGGAVLWQGRIFGAASNGSWYSLDANTGEVLAKLRRLGKGSVIYADSRLYGYTEKGVVVLVEPAPESFEVVSKFKISEGSGQHWAHPVIVDGVLYIRHGDVLMAFDIADPG